MRTAQPGLFGEGVDFGRPRPSLERARWLVAEVEGLAEEIDGYYDSCGFVKELARRMGAHSVARAVHWMAQPGTLDRHGYDAMHIRTEAVARRWLSRLERSSLPTTGDQA